MARIRWLTGAEGEVLRDISSCIALRAPGLEFCNLKIVIQHVLCTQFKSFERVWNADFLIKHTRTGLGHPGRPTDLNLPSSKVETTDKSYFICKPRKVNR